MIMLLNEIGAITVMLLGDIIQFKNYVNMFYDDWNIVEWYVS
jgi:hypothetical protein